MKINEIGLGKLPELQNLEKINKKNENGFAKVFGDFVEGVNDAQMEADKMTKDFVQGTNDVELHEVMVAAEKARTSLDLLMQIRNKALDMYKELTRMQ
jgi:flagellar hook-basal body complex protein FliE